MKKTILVTGGAGFIGINFLELMTAKYPDYRFVCYDKLTYAANVDKLAELEKADNLSFVKGDICDEKAVDELFSSVQPDIVINFAAESHVDRSIESSDIFLKTNVLGVRVLLDACRKYGTARFHQISTDEVYGEVPKGSDRVCDETSPLNPGSPYSVSKAAADMLVTSYHRTYNLPVSISRSSNNYGKYQHPEKLIPLMVKRAVNNQPMPVYGNGENIRDWLSVTDHCRAIDMIIHGGRTGEIYNICADNPVSNLKMVRLICECLSKPESLIVYVEDRKGHDFSYRTTCNKLKTELCWSPLSDFEKELKYAIASFM